MNKVRLLFAVFSAVSALPLAAVNLGYLYPAGGKAGETVEVLLGGQGMWSIREVLITGSGVRCVGIEPVQGFPHPSVSQRRYLNQWIKNIRAGNPQRPKPLAAEELLDWRKHPWYEKLDTLTPLQFELTMRFLYVPRNSLQMSPGIAQNVILKLEISPDAAPGRREIRLGGSSWISNPVPFYVGKAVEYKEPRYVPPPSKRENGTFAYPCVLNGQIMPGETDTFVFEGKKGDVVYFDFKGRTLQPFVGDGVPGHFQAILEVRDMQNRQLVLADDLYFHPDPLLVFRVPEDGRYQLLVRDALYRGREDFVYRIEIDKDPLHYQIAKPPVFAVNPVEFRRLPENVVLSIPSVVRDTLDRPGKRQEFRFSASAGDKLVAEVWARRLNSPLDAQLEIYDPEGKQIAFCDDFPRQRIGTVLQHADPAVIFTAERSGTYRAVISDNAKAGGKDYQFYFRVDRPRPDFKVYFSPSAIAVPFFGIGAVNAVVERIDGFNDPIEIILADKSGYKICGEKTIPAGCSSAVFTIDGCRAKNSRRINVKFQAKSGNKVHDVLPGDEAMQAFAYTHIVPCQGEFYLYNIWANFGSQYFAWSENSLLKLYPGSSMELEVVFKNLPPEITVTDIAMMNQPIGVVVENLKVDKTKLTFTLKAENGAKALTANQVFLVNFTRKRVIKNKKNNTTKTRVDRSSAKLPARRLVIEPLAGRK